MQILRSPPPNLPQIAARFGAPGTFGAPFAQNDRVVYLRVIGGIRWPVRLNREQMRILRLTTPEPTPNRCAFWGPWYVRGPRSLRMTALFILRDWGNPMAGATKCRCRFFDSPPPNLPQIAARWWEEGEAVEVASVRGGGGGGRNADSSLHQTRTYRKLHQTRTYRKLHQTRTYRKLHQTRTYRKLHQTRTYRKLHKPEPTPNRCALWGTWCVRG
jgi:hypothetical protein